MNAPASDEPTPSRTRRGKRALLLGSGVVALGAAVYLGVAVHEKDTIADGTTVAGKSIGGMTMTQARRQVAALHVDPAPKAHVTAGGAHFDVDPSPAWKPDVDATLRGVTGFSLSPGRMWDHLTGGGPDLRPVFTPDVATVRSIVANAAQKGIQGAPEQGKVEFVGGRVRIIEGRSGRGVDDEALARQIAGGWPKKTEYTATLETKKSAVSQAAVLAFARGDAAKAMASPLQVSANGETVTMQPSDVSAVISSQPDADGTLHLKVDSTALLDYVLSHSTDIQKDAAVDAKVVWKDDVPSVQPGKEGKEVDTASVAPLVEKALVGDHHAKLAMTTMKPQVTADDIDVKALPQTSMAHFESKFPLGESQKTRIHNITTAIDHLNGQVVLPGEQFSLLRALGYSLTKEEGYVEAGTLQNGIHVDGMGGGVSQVSTTLYNTAFFAGVQLDQHTSHAVYIDRYPVGREATLWNPGVDNTWTNDTGHLILIKTHVDTNKVVMDFYGTKKYDVSTHNGPRTHVKKPEHRTIKDVKGCENSIGNGTDGFEIDVWRTLTRGGSTVRTDKIHTTYQPDDVITCVGKTK